MRVRVRPRLRRGHGRRVVVVALAHRRLLDWRRARLARAVLVPNNGGAPSHF